MGEAEEGWSWRVGGVGGEEWAGLETSSRLMLIEGESTMTCFLSVIIL